MALPWNATGTQLTARVEIAAAAAEGARQIRLKTERGDVVGPMSLSLFTVAN